MKKDFLNIFNLSASNALSGEGIEQGSKWLVDKLANNKK